MKSYKYLIINSGILKFEKISNIFSINGAYTIDAWNFYFSYNDYLKILHFFNLLKKL